METRSKILAEYYASSRGEADAILCVYRWIIAGFEESELLRLAGGITTSALIAGQSEACHAQYIH